jgi:SAM-dependent methyltransferase
MLEGNREAIEAWNTILFDKFLQFRHLLVGALGVHGSRAMDRFPPDQGASVVDIGCGFGDTTVELGNRVGPGGRVVGVDAAARFIEAARGEATAGNVTFLVADVEESVPGGPYDYAFSRMGTMFFASPVFAFRNIRKALAPGGKLCIVVWRKKEAQDGMYRSELAVRELLGDPPKGDNVTCGPGPFSMASADVVSDQLLAAGFRDIQLARSDAPLLIGKTLDEAVRFALLLGPAGEVVRLAGDAAVARRAEIEAAVRKVIEEWSTPEGVRAPSSTWIVTAAA